MDVQSFIVNNVRTQSCKIGKHAGNGPLVARNRGGGNNSCVALFNFNGLVVAAGNAGQAGRVFTLGAGG